jgi:endonuclease-3
MSRSGKNPVLTSRLIDILEKRYGPYWWSEDFYPDDVHSDPFKHLIITILSQNTTDINSIRAYKNLSARLAIEPGVLATADIRVIKKAIKQGGLYNVKARRLKVVAREVLDKFDGDVGKVLKLPRRTAKQRLTELSGVGDKTADVVLTAVHTYREIIPIDTHMNRLATRIGLVKQKAKYGEIQDALLRFIPGKKRERASGLLWLMAKHTCRSQNPKCYECVLMMICRYQKKNLMKKETRR